MSEKERGVIIVGHSHCGLSDMRIAEIKMQHPNIQVVTVEEAKERGLSQTFEFTAPKPLSEIQQVYLKDNFFNDGKSARYKRREAERKSKKDKKRW